MKHFIFTILLYACPVYCMELKVTSKEEPYITERNISRNLISRIILLEGYKKNIDPKFTQKEEKELNNLHKIVLQKIEDELVIFQQHHSPKGQEFLSIANKNNYLNEEQKELFLEISEQNKKTTPATTVDTRARASYYPITLLLLFFLVTHQAIGT